jgi:O-antigen/teichoic acid export membrane protein
VAYPLLSLVLFLGTVLVASDRQKSWFIVTVTGALVAIIALVLLIPALGVIGAAWAMLISYVVSLMVAGYLISKAT